MNKLYFMAVLSLSAPKIHGQEIVASWYEQPGKTASGEKFDPNKLTAAHKTWPFGTEVWLKNGEKTVKVKITDRGPFVKGRHIDLSRAAAKRLGIKKDGVRRVEVTRIRRKT